mgnify:CR=1 FL=1
MTILNMKSRYMPAQAMVDVLIREDPLFSSLDNTELSSICLHIKEHKLAAGEVLFNRGDEVENFFYVVKGIIKIYRQSSNGQEKIIELEKPGQSFAEALMFFDQSCYPVSAIAMEPSTVLSIKSSFFMCVLKNSTSICMKVMGSLSHRLHDLTDEIESLSLQTGRNRVAMYFLDQSMKSGPEFKLEIPKNAIASSLSLQPETFSRLVKELVSRQAIKIQDCHVKVLDNDILRKNAGIT